MKAYSETGLFEAGRGERIAIIILKILFVIIIAAVVFMGVYKWGVNHDIDRFIISYTADGRPKRIIEEWSEKATLYRSAFFSSLSVIASVVMLYLNKKISAKKS